MSLFLVQVGKSTWVDPDAIQAIEWNQMSEYPMLILSSGRSINAPAFKDMASAAITSNAEAGTKALLALLQQAHLKRDQS